MKTKLSLILFLIVAPCSAQHVIEITPPEPVSNRLIVKPSDGSGKLAGGWEIMEAKSVGDVTALAKRLKASGKYLAIEQDQLVWALETTPNDPLWPQQWDMTMIDCPSMWDFQTDASDVIVAVIDTGVDFNHPDLIANLWTGPSGEHGYTFFGSVTPGGQDDQGHGTHCAGTIGARGNNGTGMAGINWGVKIMSLKFLNSGGSGSLSDALLAFNKIAQLIDQGHNIRVSNNSWGGGGYSQALVDAMAACESRGCVNACAAGNFGGDADSSPMYPAAYSNRGIISVQAHDSNGAGAFFSAYGLGSTDISAPGVGTLSTLPTNNCSLCSATGYGHLSGTSMATPHVSGVLAALFAINPTLTAHEARDVLLDFASYEPSSDSRISQSTTGGRLNAYLPASNPLLTAPVLNNFPVVVGDTNIIAQPGQVVQIDVSATDADGDDLLTRMNRQDGEPFGLRLWAMSPVLHNLYPTGTSNLNFTAPRTAYPSGTDYSAAATDRRGGSDLGLSSVWTLADPTIVPRVPSGPVTVTNLDGQALYGIEFCDTNSAGAYSFTWHAHSASGCCQFGDGCGSARVLAPGDSWAYRMRILAVTETLVTTDEPNVVMRKNSTLEPPVGSLVLNTITGVAPLTVTYDASGSTDSDGSIARYLVKHHWDDWSQVQETPQGSFYFASPGIYLVTAHVIDNHGLWDNRHIYVFVSPPGQPVDPQPPVLIPPTDLIAVATGNAVNLAWSDTATRETHWIVTRAAYPWLGARKIATLPPGARDYTDTPVAPGKYRYRVRCCQSNPVKCSTNSNTAKVIVR